MDNNLKDLSDVELLKLVACTNKVYNEILSRFERGNKASNMIKKMFGKDQKLDKFIMKLEREESSKR